jgi:hypothetical protein
MKKTKKILYWIATLWLALGMASTGIVQLMRTEDELALMQMLGYPAYLLTILGTWKLLGTMVVLIPRFPLLKEWAYAGFFFAMSGAVTSHLMSGSPAGKIFPSLLLLVLTLASWFLRPQERRMVK